MLVAFGRLVQGWVFSPAITSTTEKETLVKKKVDCGTTLMIVRIASILAQPVSEADGSGSPIHIEELRGLLGEDFEFSTEELVCAINHLSANSQIRLICTQGGEDGDDLIVTSILPAVPTPKAD